MEKTLVIIKPDGVQRGLIGEIISRLEKVGYKIIDMKMFYADESLAGKHYAADDEWLEEVGRKQRASYEKKVMTLKETNKELGHKVRNYLLTYISMSPVVALIIEGHNAVAHVRKMCGATSPQDSSPGTIRGDLAFDTFQLADDSKRPIQNLIHASGT
ncbi:nucleoside-diphosphate kinase, partial [Candidatus Woesearchaeota archaeon]|nr:nucleoside-diphosphate kinase [Candidatus Woesearchaeota archaeon]